MIVAEIRVVSNNLPRAASALRSGLPAVVGGTVRAVGGLARSYAAVDTGEMQGGVTEQHAGLSGSVSDPVEHATYNEFGTARMAARPFMRPAADAARPGFESAARALLGRLA